MFNESNLIISVYIIERFIYNFTNFTFLISMPKENY